MDFDAWRVQATSPDESDRVDAAESPPFANDSGEVVEVLVQLLKDESDLVRACAADSLRFFRGNKVAIRSLVEFLDVEREVLPRAYGYSSLGELADLGQVAHIVEDWDKASDPRLRLHAALGTLRGVLQIAVVEIARCSRSPDETISESAYNAAEESISALRRAIEEVRKVSKGNPGRS